MLVLVASLLFISSFVVQKFAFLLFYFIPVLLAGYYLSPKHAVLTAVLTAGLVTYVTVMDPFGLTGDAAGEGLSFWNLLTWASFLDPDGRHRGQAAREEPAADGPAP